jgi:NADP-dependent 3-hydroxy acid dehydrogenase YdfG
MSESVFIISELPKQTRRRVEMGKLDGKVAVVTGATSGMALASAKLFVEEGAHVFITGRRQDNLDNAVKAIGRNVTGVQGDSAKLADLDRLYETVRWEKGYIDVVFASAGHGDGNYLYTLNSGTGSVGIYSINSDGTLSNPGDIEGLPKTVGFNGIAAL